MDNGQNEDGLERRVNLQVREAETAAYKIDALLNLLEQKKIITADEARDIRIAKVL